MLTFLNLKIKLMLNWLTMWKLFKYRVFPGPYFPVFELLIPIQSEYRKIRIRQNSVFGHFSLSDCSFFRCWCLPIPQVSPVISEDTGTNKLRRILPISLISFVVFATVVVALLLIASWDRDEKRIKSKTAHNISESTW